MVWETLGVFGGAGHGWAWSPLPWLAGALALGAAAGCAALLSPVRARVRGEAGGGRPAWELEVELLWGLFRLEHHLGRQGADRPRPRPRAPVGRPAAGGRRLVRLIAADPPLRRSLAVLRGRLRILRLQADLTIGMGDPAATAVAVGAAEALGAALWAPLAVHLRADGLAPPLHARPDYARTGLDLRLDCIATIRLGHLMVALAALWVAVRRHRHGARRGSRGSRGAGAAAV